ncbi:MAG: hypothetical protein V2I46_02020 [Bacteroides sp.]|nr:hypothetical protein [Bacteroides sp.]
MPLRFLSFIFWVILFAVKPCAAQESPANSFHFDQKIVFEPYPDSKERITNHLLQHIADGSGRLRSMVSYSLEGQIALQLDVMDDGRQLAFVSLETLRVSGDISYGGFSLEKLLMPDLVQFNVLISQPDGKLIGKKEHKDLPVIGSNVILQEEIPGGKSNNDLVVRIEDIHFSYSESMYHRLDEWFAFFEDYYAAVTQIEELENVLATLNFSDPSHLILEEFSLCEAEKKLASFAVKGFFVNLDPQAGDPEGIFLKHGRLSKRVQFLRNEFNLRMAIVDSLIYAKGMNLLASDQPSAARESFESSLVFNPLFVPSYLALAKIDLEGGQKRKAIERLGEVFSVIIPHGKLRKESEILTDSIMAQFFRDAFNFNREGRFKESLDLLAPLEQFCERVEGEFECPYELEFRLNQTHMGMYRSFLVVGGRALRNDNLSLCRTYVSSALDYQKNNQRFIPDAREAFDILQQCVYRYIEISGERFAVGEFQRSYESLNAALELCSQYPGLFCPDDLSSRQQMVLAYVQQKETDSRIHTESVNPAESNERFSDDIFWQPEEEMLELISQGQFLAWAGKVEDAKAAEEKILLTIQNLRLKNDARIASEMDKLGVMIQEKECELAARELEALLQKGMRYLAFSEYKSAFEAGMEIKERIESFPQCSFHASDSIDRLINLEPVLIYLNLADAATSFYQSASLEQYPDFLRKYHEAEFYFEKQDLTQQGLNHVNLITFITSSKNVELAKAGVAYMAEQAENYASESVSLLWFLKGQGLPSSDTRALQELAGRKLARYYYSKEPEIQPESLVNSLTQNDRWFRLFEQTFIRYWGNN